METIDNFDETIINFTTFDTSNINIPAEKGNYLICLKEGKNLPYHNELDIPNYIQFNGLNVLYTGVSSDLRKRLLGNHIAGLGKSSFRLSLGVYFNDTIQMSNWLIDNLKYFYIVNSNAELLEKSLIEHFNPPFNLKQNQHHINEDFRKNLGIKR